VDLPNISDDMMNALRPTAKAYCLVILRDGPNRRMPGVDAIIWEHGRRNFALRAAGLLSIVCPVPDESEVCGIYIFNVDTERVSQIMGSDPGVHAGVFVYDLHPCRGFPGDCLAG